MKIFPRILAVSTGTPEKSFSQEELEKLLGVTGDKRTRFFRHEHVRRRHFLFNGPEFDGTKLREETLLEQRQKFKKEAPRLSADVLKKALKSAGVNEKDIGCLVAVSSSGYFTPGLSVMVSREMNLSAGISRIDIAGMGCHAGINGLSAVRNWCGTHPGKIGVLLCTELSSCIYNLADTDNNALVNSLFGDGIAVLILRADSSPGPALIDFHSYLIPDSENFLTFEWDQDRSLYGFQIDKRTPETIGKSVSVPVTEFLKRNSLSRDDISEWVVHGGGEAILSSIQSHLGLHDENLRHTRSVLRDFGNVASGSFIFSFERLMSEKKLKAGDNVVLMTMGPGLSVEMALVKWE